MFEEAHASLEELRRVLAGEASPVEAELVAAHLRECRDCWMLAIRAIAALGGDGLTVSQGGSLRHLIELHDLEQVRLAEWLESQALWVEIRPMTLKARRDKIRLTRALHTLSFLEVLIEEGTSSGPGDSEELFYLALLAAQQLEPPRVSAALRHDLCAECCAEMANARRRGAKWAAARDALRKGFEYAEKGSGNGVAEGKVLAVAGALEDDLGNTERAVETLRRATVLFESGKQTFLLSRTLTQLAYVLVGEDPSEGLRYAEQALALIPPNSPRLLWFAETAKVDCLIGIGAPQEALILFRSMKALTDQFREPFIQLRRRFNAAKILEHLGNNERAEVIFQEVIAGDLEYGLIKDFFLDLVYLFGFYLKQGKGMEAIAVCRRASQELSLLDDEEGSDETAREQMQLVWRSLEAEVKGGRVDLKATGVLRNYIKAHWRFPASAPPFFGERTVADETS